MVVFHVKRVWDDGAWHDVEFLYEATVTGMSSTEVCAILTTLYQSSLAYTKFRGLIDISKLPPQAQEMITRVLDSADKLFSAQQVSMHQCVSSDDAQTALDTIAFSSRQIGIADDVVQQTQTLPPCPNARIVWCKKFVDGTRTVSELSNGNPKTVLNVFLSVDGTMPVF